MSYSSDTGIGRLLWQYRDSPNVQALVRSMLLEYETLTEAIETLKTRLDIDASVGEQLDGIGEIVGRERPATVLINDDGVFSFDGPDAGQGFGGLTRPDVGGRFTGLGGIVVGPMTDAEYRVLLKATIFANYGNSSVDHITEYAQAVVGADVQVVDGVGYIGLFVGRPMSAPEADLIRDTIPLAAGVRLGYISTGTDPDDGPAGFDDGAFVGII